MSQTGATDLQYDHVRIAVDSPTRVRLADDWRMNGGRGIEDHFEVQDVAAHLT